MTEYKIDLHPNDHVFMKGHRIMVQVQSTWFPLYDRNPQKFVPNIYKATDADYTEGDAEDLSLERCGVEHRAAGGGEVRDSSDRVLKLC